MSIGVGTGMIVSGLGSALLGGIGGLLGQSSTNKTNLQIARETNEQNYRIWQEQKAHNKDMFNLENQANIDMFNMQNQAAIDMWNMQNAYNDPSAQVERLKNAGLNPLNVLNSSGTASGNATSAPSVGNLSSATAQPAQAPTMVGTSVTSPFQAAWANAMQGIQVMMQGLNTALTTKPQIDNLNAGTENLKASANLATQQAVKTHFDAKIQESYSKYAPTLFAEQVEGIKYQNDIASIDALYHREIVTLNIATMRAQLSYQQLANDHQAILNAFLPGEKQLAMFQMGEQIAMMQTQHDFLKKDLENYYTRYLMVNVAQANLLGKQAVGQDIKNQSDAIDLGVKQSLDDAGLLKSVAKACAEATEMQSMLNFYRDANESVKHSKEYWNRIKYPKAMGVVDAIEQGLSQAGRVLQIPGFK